MTLATLPNSELGATTETVGAFKASDELLTSWLRRSLGREWRARRLPRLPIRQHLESTLTAVREVDTYLLCAVDSEWTIVFTDGPIGTDLGVLPSRASRQLGIRAVRATAVDPGSASYEASILEVFAPDSSDPQLCRRSIFAANDGGKWRFGEHGDRFQFEDTDAYARSRVKDRLSPALVRRYMVDLGIPAIGLDGLASARSVARSGHLAS